MRNRKERPSSGLYTPEQRRRRDQSRWTLIQGILAPAQFIAFLVSLILLLRYLLTGEGLGAAETSILLKTSLLAAIMITGSFWERAVFGRWLFVPAFFWEDVVSMGVIALHAAYVWMLFTDTGSKNDQMFVALAAYAAYAVNAAQFLLKFRLARAETPDEDTFGSDLAIAGDRA